MVKGGIRAFLRSRLWDVILATLAIGLFASACRNDFINLDDPTYVTNNPHVLSGLTRHNVVWAMTTLHNGFWHPLTWLSLQLDASLFGRAAWGCHLSNILWHAATVVLLFRTLFGMTGNEGRSALVAALFAVHPLRVESVVWVTERKDVLAAFFWVAAMWSYGRYVLRPRIGWYLLVCAGMMLSLMAKPMAVTLPFALLLLDYWPLGRLGSSVNQERSQARMPWYRLVLEKIPLLALGLGFAALTLFAHREYLGEVRAGEVFGVRAARALIHYCWYLQMTFLPVGLTLYYPYPAPRALVWQALLAFVALAVITLVAWRWRRREPALIVGWLWFLGTLFPVIGLIASGEPVADRFTYIPHIGLMCALVWVGADLAGILQRRLADSPVRQAGVAVFVVALAVWAFLSHEQIAHWRNSQTLWQYALKVNPKNVFAWELLGADLRGSGRLDEALHCFDQACRLDPLAFEPHYKRVELLLMIGRLDDAERQATAFLEMKDPSPAGLRVCWFARAQASHRRGNLPLAIEHYRKALEYEDALIVRSNLGIALAQSGQLEEAARHLKTAYELDTSNAMIAYNHGVVLGDLGKWSEAIDPLRRAVELQERAAPYRTRLAMALIASGQTDEARRHASVARQLDPAWLKRSLQSLRQMTGKTGDGKEGAALLLADVICASTDTPEPQLLDTLAETLAAAGRFERATEIARTAAEQAERVGNTTLAAAARQRAEHYRAGQR